MKKRVRIDTGKVPDKVKVGVPAIIAVLAVIWLLSRDIRPGEANSASSSTPNTSPLGSPSLEQLSSSINGYWVNTEIAYNPSALNELYGPTIYQIEYSEELASLEEMPPSGTQLFSLVRTNIGDYLVINKGVDIDRRMDQGHCSYTGNYLYTIAGGNAYMFAEVVTEGATTEQNWVGYFATLDQLVSESPQP